MISKQSIAIISILVVGTLFGVGYATSTVISDTGITTPSITVSGACNGCGNSGSFSSYNTILYNITSTFGTHDGNGELLKIGNDGSIVSVGDTSLDIVIASNGTEIYNKPTVIGAFPVSMVQTPDGTYKVVVDIVGTDNIKVYKNNNLLQTLGIDQLQFSGGTLTNGRVSVGISEDGHYIAVGGIDSSNNADRFIVFEGS